LRAPHTQAHTHLVSTNLTRFSFSRSVRIPIVFLAVCGVGVSTIKRLLPAAHKCVWEKICQYNTYYWMQKQQRLRNTKGSRGRVRTLFKLSLVFRWKLRFVVVRHKLRHRSPCWQFGKSPLRHWRTLLQGRQRGRQWVVQRQRDSTDCDAPGRGGRHSCVLIVDVREPPADTLS